MVSEAESIISATDTAFSVPDKNGRRCAGGRVSPATDNEKL
jgi:hypothetical protein